MADKVKEKPSKAGAQGAEVVVPKPMQKLSDVIAHMREENLNLGFNTVTHDYYCTGPTAWSPDSNVRRWRDYDTVQLYMRLQDTYGLKDMKMVERAIVVYANENSFDPLQKKLDSLPKWDGIERAETIFIKYLDIEDTEFARAATKVWLCEAIKRVYVPGAKCDYVIVLVGKAGVGKSTILRLLALDDELFTDALCNFGNLKAFAEIISGKWICEFSELAAIRSSRFEAVKAAITRCYDTYRPAYARQSIDRPRRTVFAGTSNDVGFLQNVDTGARRFLPFLCGDNPNKEIFDPAFRDVVKQVWAEVLAWYHDPEKYGFSVVLSREMEAEAAIQRESFIEDDPKVALIKDYLSKPETRDHLVCALEICEKVFGVAHSQVAADGCSTTSNMALWKQVHAILENQCSDWAYRKRHMCGTYGKQRCYEYIG